MAGYTPLFDSLTTGTLYGRWPDIGLWAVILSLPDKRGIVDVTPEYLAGVTGLPAADVIACMDRFCQPDPRSRSGSESGARLLLIDPARSWGWRIVNHGLYREKARKMAYDADRTSSGADAQRKRKSREVPASPAKSREVPLSDADADADSNKEKKPSLRSGRAPVRARSRRCPPEFAITAELRSWAREACPQVDIDRETESFRDHEFRNAHSDWVAVWRQWMRRVTEFRRTSGAASGKPETTLTWRPGPDD